MVSRDLADYSHQRATANARLTGKLQLQFSTSWMPECPRTAFDATGNQVLLLLLATGLFVAWMESFTEQEKAEEADSN